MPIWSKCWTIRGLSDPQNKSVFRPINTLNWVQTCEWEVTAYESSGSLRFCRPWCFFFNLIKYYFAFKTRLKISDQKLLNFAECIAGKGKFCGRDAAASCAKNYGDRLLLIWNTASGKNVSHFRAYTMYTSSQRIKVLSLIDMIVKTTNLSLSSKDSLYYTNKMCII